MAQATRGCRPNDQAFIRRASRMADKTSWTKPPGVHGVRGFYRGGGAARSRNGRCAGAGWDRCRSWAGAIASGRRLQTVRARCGAGPRSLRAQRTGVAASRAAVGGRGMGVSGGSRGVPGCRRRRQDGEPAQEAPRAARTAVDVDACHAEHHLAGRLRRGDRRGRLR